MKLPQLAIYADKLGNRSLLGRWPAKSLRAGLADEYSLIIKESYRTLFVVVEDCRAAVSQLFLDGNKIEAARYGEYLVLRIELCDDLEMHRVSFVQMPDVACTLDLQVNHENQVKIGGVYAAASKWKRQDFDREFLRFRAIFGAQRAVLPDYAAQGLKFGSSKQLDSVLAQLVVSLSYLVGGLRKSELLTDFSKKALSGIDREGILSHLKQDPRRLTKDAEGSIEVSNCRYTTDVNIQLLGRSSIVEMSPTATLLDNCAGLLSKSSAPAITGVILRYIADELHVRFGAKRDATDADINSLVDRPMHSALGSELQSKIRLLLAYIQEKAARDASQQGLSWLQQSIRDFDLFQAMAFLFTAMAHGFDEKDALINGGVLQRPGIKVINGNREGALAAFFAVSAGWRQLTKQPSGFKPDIVVMLDGKQPVILDAKFSVSWSESMPLPASPLKEVQAYLDEFDLPGAVLIIPKVVCAAHVENGQIKLLGTSRTGRQRLIIGVPVQDPASITAQIALRSAVESIANMV